MRLSEQGFTLTELLVACAISGVVLAGVHTVFQSGTITLKNSLDGADAQASARWAVSRMFQEIRGAGYDPTAVGTAYHFDAVAGPTTTTITLQNDLNGNGMLDAATGACDPSAAAEVVGYRLVGTELRRSTNPPAYTCEDTIADGVVSLQLTYFDADGVATATAALVRSIGVSVRMQSAMGARRQVALVDRVRLRNR